MIDLDAVSMTPAWILVNDGDVFEGHQGNWRNAFFSNALLSNIVVYCLRQGWSVQLRPMTEEELDKYPEALGALHSLEQEYGAETYA